MRQRRATFYSGPGLRLVGILALPECEGHPDRKAPTVVLCHGPGGYKDPENLARDTIMPAVSEWLTRAGYAAFRFGYRGVGESEGPAYRLIPMEQVEDIRNAITFVQQQPEVDAARIGLFGAGIGASNATYCAGVDERVKCVVGLSTMGDLGRWLRALRPYWAWVEWLRALELDRAARVLTGASRLVQAQEVVVSDPRTAQYVAAAPQFNGPPRLLSLESAEALAGFRPEAVVHRISPRAAMWICAAGDTLTPIEESRSLYEKAREPKRLVVLERAIHHGLYHSPDFDRVMQNTVEWLDNHLK